MSDKKIEETAHIVEVRIGKWMPRNTDKYGCPTVPNFDGCLSCEMIGKCYIISIKSKT